MLATNRSSRSKFWTAPLPKLPWQRNAMVLGTGALVLTGLTGIAVLFDKVGTNIKSATEWPKSKWAAAEKKRAVGHEMNCKKHKLKALESNCDYRLALVEGAILRGLVLAAGVGLFATVAFTPRRKRIGSQVTRGNYVKKRLAIGGGLLGTGYLTREDLRPHYHDYLAAKKSLRAFSSATSKTSLPS